MKLIQFNRIKISCSNDKIPMHVLQHHVRENLGKVKHLMGHQESSPKEFLRQLTSLSEYPKVLVVVINQDNDAVATLTMTDPLHTYLYYDKEYVLVD